MQNDLVTKEDLILFTSGSRFTLGSIYVQEGFKDTIANFDLFVREMPTKRNYLVFAGLEHVLDFLLNLKFTDKQLYWLKKTYKFPPKVMNYYKNFKFTGDVYAMPEGSIFFANEPIIRIVAPIIEAQVIEIYLTNTVFLQTILASKISRFINATNGKMAVFGFNRSYGLDVAMKLDRVGKIVGTSQSSVCITNFLNPTISTWSTHMFHHFITAFENEIDAFRAHLKHYPGNGTVLVDTYDTIQGVKNFIVAALESKRKTGLTPKNIMLDSGNLYDLSLQARRLLDKAGLKSTKIMATSNLDEYKVHKLEKLKAPIDIYSGTTNILTPIDAPVLEVVYKLSEIIKKGKKIPKMKLSNKKISLPGRKQVYRIIKKGQYMNDVIGLEKDVVKGKKMLQKYISNGKLIKK
ncbi:MAG: nicotinate phosphoribosyltransferase, partial [Candidatus Margulisiibacteriota bacterium]